MTEHFAVMHAASFYCENCDSTQWVHSQGAILQTFGWVRCDCSDFEGEE